MARLEDNLPLALSIPAVVTAAMSLLIKRPVPLLSLWATLIAVVGWLAIMSVAAGEVSSIWPIALVGWFIFFYPVAVLVRLPFLIRQRRRIVMHQPVCRFCGYSLIGNLSGVCPECGKPVQVEKEAD